MCLCECAFVYYFTCVQTNRKRTSLSRSSNQSKGCQSKLTLAHLKINSASGCQTIQSEIDNQNELKNGENRKINFAYITFFVVNATFVLQFCSFMVLFPNQTSEIDLPRISLVFFVFLFVSVILFILICLHSSYNIYKTSQKYKRIC